MDRAKPSVIRNALTVAHDYAKAGLTFVCVPVDSDQQHAEAVAMAARNINSMLESLEDEE